MSNSTSVNLVKLFVGFSFSTSSVLSFADIAHAAGLVLQPLNVSTNYNVISNTSVNSLINQSGLSQFYTSEVTDFDFFVAETTHSTLTSGNAAQFLSPDVDPNGSIVFELGSSKTIEGIAVWNSNLNSINDFGFFYDNDNDFSNGTLGFLGSITGTIANPIPADVLTFSPVNASFVHLKYTSASNSAPALGEVAFKSTATVATAVPESRSIFSTIVVFGLGVFFMNKKRAF